MRTLKLREIREKQALSQRTLAEPASSYSTSAGKYMGNLEISEAPSLPIREALNSIRGDDDLALRGALFKKILSAIPRS